MILKYVCPDYRVKSIFDISPKWLKRNGYMKIVVDIDNTLLPRDKNMVGPRAMTWIRQMHQLGINVALISNNGGDRIKAITRQTNLGAIMRAAKPLPMLRHCGGLSGGAQPAAEPGKMYADAGKQALRNRAGAHQF